jgi:rubrerythrin
MSKIFYFSEIVKFAIEREIESFNLYKKLAENAKDSSIKQLFLTLMTEEKAHEAFYEEILSAVKMEQTPGVSEDTEYEEYVKEMIDSGRKTKQITEVEMQDVKLAVNFALERERDAVVFYTSIKNYLASAERKHVEVIIAEELRHMVMLTNLRKKIA